MFNKIMGILDYRHSFYEFMRKLLWVFLTNILFLVTSIPIFTIGASLTAMFAVLQKLVQEREFNLFKDYFGSFFRNFGKATAIWIVCMIVGVICWFDITFFIGMLEVFGAVGYVLLGVAIIITLAVLLYGLAIFPILAEFEGSLKDTITVLKFVVKNHLKQCIGAVIATVIIIGFAIAILWNQWFIFIYYPIMSVGLTAFVLAYMYDSILRPYYEEDEELEEYDGSEE